jgi:hypothetical protein
MMGKVVVEYPLEIDKLVLKDGREIRVWKRIFDAELFEDKVFVRIAISLSDYQKFWKSKEENENE